MSDTLSRAERKRHPIWLFFSLHWSTRHKAFMRELIPQKWDCRLLMFPFKQISKHTEKRYDPSSDKNLASNIGRQNLSPFLHCKTNSYTKRITKHNTLVFFSFIYLASPFFKLKTIVFQQLLSILVKLPIPSNVITCDKMEWGGKGDMCYIYMIKTQSVILFHLHHCNMSPFVRSYI